MNLLQLSDGTDSSGVIVPTGPHFIRGHISFITLSYSTGHRHSLIFSHVDIKGHMTVIIIRMFLVENSSFLTPDFVPPHINLYTIDCTYR